MEKTNTVIAVFADHNAAEGAVKKLTAAGFEMKNLSVVGKGYHTDEKVVGFYNAGDRIKFWGTRRDGARHSRGSSSCEDDPRYGQAITD
jgi:Heat induced stress protein YflT domain